MAGDDKQPDDETAQHVRFEHVFPQLTELLLHILLLKSQNPRIHVHVSHPFVRLDLDVLIDHVVDLFGCGVCREALFEASLAVLAIERLNIRFLFHFVQDASGQLRIAILNFWINRYVM